MWGLAASIVNVTVGGGIFRLPASAAAALGAGAPAAYLVCSAAMGLIALCYAEAGSRVSLTGGPYAYVETAFGAFVGFLAGVLVWLLGTFAVAAVSTILGDSLAAMAPALGAGPVRGGVLVAIFAVLGGVNVLGVRRGVAVNVVATAAKLVPLLLLVVAGAFSIRADNVAPAGLPSAGSVARASVLLIFAYSGVESALVPSGEILDVRRTVPRAILLSMTAITVLYLALQIVAQGLLGAALAGQNAPLAEAAAVVFGPAGRTLMLVGATVSMFGYVSGMTLAVPRALFAFARDGFLPRPLAAVHPVFHTPHVAIVAQSALVCALAVTNGFERLAILANLVTLILYGVCCLAAWELRRRHVAAGGTPSGIPGGAWIPWVACALIVYMLTSVTAAEWGAVLAVLAIAAGVFLATRGARARQERAGAAA